MTYWKKQVKKQFLRTKFSGKTIYILKKTNFPILAILVGVLYLLFSDSCANPGSGPQGGPKDSIPPVILNMIPQNYQTNVTSNEIIISFDEYIVPDNLTGKIMVSPPLAEKPSIKTKGKSIIITFDEDLIPNRTYSVDLQDGIKDYNEGNKIESIRMLFSTYDKIDTLRISGYFVDAYTKSPLENTVATLYTINNDSVFSTLRPDFIARANNEGFFMFDNLPEGKYKLYGLIDLNNDLIYSQAEEQIAFIDSFIIPSANFIAKIDTIINEGDTIINTGYTNFFPEQVHSFLFKEDKYLQFIIEEKRLEKDKILLVFNESITDSFSIQLLDADTSLAWNYIEYGTNMDSVNIWITDTSIVNNDSLLLRVDYTVQDTLNQIITQTDTLKMYFSPKEKQKTKNKKSKEAELQKEIETFSFNSNLSSTFDLNVPIILEAGSPLQSFEDSLIRFQKVINDSTFEKLTFSVEPYTVNSNRKYKLNCQIEEGISYLISIDSATIQTQTGIHNLAFESKFKTKSSDQYGTAIFKLTGLEKNAVIQLLKNSKDETVLREIKLDKDNQEAIFAYLKPSKYIVKLWIDENNNEKWDTGNLQKRKQPEPVFYFNKIINIKANWELIENWNIDNKAFELKNLSDPDKKDDK